MRMLKLILAAFALAFLVTGCDSVSDRLSARFEKVEPKSRWYKAEQKVVFAAAETAMKTIDFKVTRSRETQGIVEGLSRLLPGTAFGDTKQHTVSVKVFASAQGYSTVEVLVKEQEETADFKGATDIALKDHGLYDSYFAALEQALQAQGVKIEEQQMVR